tara:strand:+ start:114 stop:302 length:189 start_codon:yes stop_codon:yes gene_type:complete
VKYQQFNQKPQSSKQESSHEWILQEALHLKFLMLDGNALPIRLTRHQIGQGVLSKDFDYFIK